MIEYLIFGLLQGITEWLPISSQGQTILVSQMFGMELGAALNLSIWLHSGTLLAAVVYFRKELLGLFKSEEKYLLRFFILSTLVTALIGAPLYLFFVSAFAESAGGLVIGVIGVMLIVSGLIQRSAKGKTRVQKDVKDKDSLIVGLFQGFAALPGISRSGMTTSVLLFRGFDSKSALKLSFMMSIFAVGAAEIGLQLKGGFVISSGAFIAMIGAFVTGIISIDLLLKLAQKIKFWKFLIVLGVLSLVPLLFVV